MKPLCDINSIMVCADCDLILPRKEPEYGYTLCCPRCGKRLAKSKSNSINKSLALSLTGLLMYLPAMLLPLLTFENLGFSDSANVVESIVNFFQNGYLFVSFMVFISALVMPLLLLLFIFVITFCLYKNRYSPYLKKLFKHYLHLEEWAMLEVYLLGIMITIIKMADSTEIEYHSGVFCFSGLVLITLAMTTTVDKALFWRLLDSGDRAKENTASTEKRTFIKNDISALKCGIIQCHTCHKVVPEEFNNSDCPRCGSTLQKRLPQTMHKTWALVMTSILMLFPANLLPIMEVSFLGIPDRSTIMDGIIYFFQHGSYFIGLIIFTASILVPIFKIIGLTILLLTTRPCATGFLKQKTAMYRFIVFIGRWSMLDVFVIALLTSLVDFGFFTSIHAAPGATFFCLVVASTMLAAITFDPRTIWDRCYCNTSSSQHFHAKPADQP